MPRLFWLPTLLAAACAPKLEVQPCASTLTEGAYECDVPGWEHRGYYIVLPQGYDPSTPVPVVIDFHGGGGSKKSSARETCEDGDPSSPTCLHNDLADREGFAVLYPDGHPGSAVARNLRTWNAGGGEGKWRATGDRAFEDDVDDTQFVEDLLDDLERRMAVDTSRVYATGLSNGGAMSHRLACTLSERIAAVAPIGAGMQWTTTHDCAPTRRVPMLYTHGADDPCWVYEGGPSKCPIGQKELEHVSAQRTLDEWSVLLGCTGPPVEDTLPDLADDGTRTVRLTYPGCDLVHLRVEGGGHTWPNGWQYLREKTVGPVWRDWGNEVLWNFLSAHRLP